MRKIRHRVLFFSCATKQQKTKKEKKKANKQTKKNCKKRQDAKQQQLERKKDTHLLLIRVMVNTTTTTQKVLLVAFSVGFVLCEYRWYRAKEKKRVEGIFPKDDDDDDGVKVIKAKKTTPAEKKKKKQKRERKQSFWKEETEESESDNDDDDDSVRIFYASTSGNARSLAQKLGADLDRTVIDLSEVLEPEKTFANEEEEEEGILKMERKKGAEMRNFCRLDDDWGRNRVRV